MFIKQLSVFVENKPGRLAEITSALGANDVDIRALSISDTRDFGILRLITDRPDEAEKALKAAEDIAGKITAALGGWGIFGVEMFIRGDEVIFSEVSPRPHDTGMVTMITQDLSQFALHARAVLGLPIPNIVFHGAGASRAVVVEGDSDRLSLGNLDKVLEQPDTQMRFFGKPEVHGHRRMAVLLARGLDVTEAREKTGVMMERLNVKL